MTGATLPVINVATVTKRHRTCTERECTAAGHAAPACTAHTHIVS